MTAITKKRKFYAYVDESGQDTKGKFFVLSVLILENNRELISKKLKEIEKQSKKQNIKWSKAYFKFRKKYMEEILKSNFLKETLFFEIFKNGKSYLKFTAQATCKAILNKTKNIIDYKTTIYIDGFNQAELEKFSNELKKQQLKSARKLRGVKKDGNNIFIRLADAICGLVRQAQEKNQWAEYILQELMQS